MLTAAREQMDGEPRRFKTPTLAQYRRLVFPGALASRAAIAACLFGSFAFLPLVMAQGAATRAESRVCLPPGRHITG